jgi:hypothetical protein
MRLAEQPSGSHAVPDSQDAARAHGGTPQLLQVLLLLDLQPPCSAPWSAPCLAAVPPLLPSGGALMTMSFTLLPPPLHPPCCCCKHHHYHCCCPCCVC